MRQIGENELLRFASAELSATEEEQFLAWCEIEPEHWRDACLAVVEHRRIGLALRDFSEAAGERPALAVTAAPRRRFGNLPMWAALAAGLLLGSVGMRLVGIERTSVPTPATQAIAAESSVAPAAVPTEVASREVVVNATDGASSALADALSLRPLIGESESSVLRQHGFQIEEKPELYIVEAGDGTRWALPVQRATLHYVKH